VQKTDFYGTGLSHQKTGSPKNGGGRTGLENEAARQANVLIHEVLDKGKLSEVFIVPSMEQ
jgi:hypothetical protein